jgi:hypothetical protein
MRFFRPLIAAFCLSACLYGAESGPGWVSFGPVDGRKVVLIAGDEEYRSEESLPMLAQVLAKHGMRCTVLFSHDADGTINPNNAELLGAPEKMEGAELFILGLRFRRWSDADMARFDAAMQRGVPVIALRTSTHAFQFKGGRFLNYNQFGPQVLGAGWISHWGHHAVEATRTSVESSHASHPILRGVGEIFGKTDVYEVYPPADAQILLRGNVLVDMSPQAALSTKSKKRSTDKVEQPVNQPAMPVAWIREFPRPNGVKQRVFCTTMASASDLVDVSLRRLIVNASYWGLGLEVPASADVEPVGIYKPSDYAFNRFRKGVKAADFIPANK